MLSGKLLKMSLVLPLAALLLSACSSAPEPVVVTLTEFGIQSSVAEFKVGETYSFTITNSGTLNHEFTLMPAGAMIMPMEGHDMEHMEGALLHIGEDQLTPGATVTLDYTITGPAYEGALEFACHLPGHYEAGMFTPVVVNAS